MSSSSSLSFLCAYVYIQSRHGKLSTDGNNIVVFFTFEIIIKHIWSTITHLWFYMLWVLAQFESNRCKELLGIPENPSCPELAEVNKQPVSKHDWASFCEDHLNVDGLAKKSYTADGLCAILLTLFQFAFLLFLVLVMCVCSHIFAWGVWSDFASARIYPRFDETVIGPEKDCMTTQML